MNPTPDSYGQPVGPEVVAWTARPWPAPVVLEGRTCVLEPLDVVRHSAQLYAANAAADERMWTYLPYGPFGTLVDYQAWMDRFVADDTLVPFAIVERHGARALGVATYLRVVPEMGCVEVGHLAFSPALRATTIATEAMALMMGHVFDDLGYRRYEWKCDALNGPSRRAASRLGFVFEGIFRQAVVVRGRNRDTAWYSVVDREWPRLRHGFERWLDPANFDAQGRQRRRLAELRSPPEPSAS